MTNNIKVIRGDSVKVICNGYEKQIEIGSGNDTCLEYACIGKQKDEEFYYLGIKIKIIGIKRKKDIIQDVNHIPRVSEFFNMPSDHTSLEAERVKFGYVNDATERIAFIQELAEFRAKDIPVKQYGQNSVKGTGKQGEFIEPSTKIIFTDYVDLNEYRQFRKKPYEIRLDYSIDGTDDVLTLYLGLHNVYDTIVENDGIQYRLLNKTHVLQWKTCFDQIVGQDRDGFIEIRSKYISDNLDMTLESLLHNLSGKFEYQGKKYKLKLRRSYSFDWQTGVSYETEYDENEHKEIIDPYLRKVLADKRRQHQATNIVFSIQEEQRKIMYEPLEKNIIVQGCAGSGKTMILMHRISILLSRERNLRSSNILILTPNELFAQSLQYLSSELEMTKVPRKSIDTFYREAIKNYFSEYKFEEFCDETQKYNYSKLKALYSTPKFEEASSFERAMFEKKVSIIESSICEIEPFLKQYKLNYKINNRSPYQFYKINKGFIEEIKKGISANKERLLHVKSEIDKLEDSAQKSTADADLVKNKLLEAVPIVVEKIISDKERCKDEIENLNTRRENILDQLIQEEQIGNQEDYFKANGEINFDTIAQSGNEELQKTSTNIRSILRKLEELEDERTHIPATKIVERRQIRQEISELEEKLESLYSSIPKRLTEQERNEKLSEADEIDRWILQRVKKIKACELCIHSLVNASNDTWPDLEKIPGHEILEAQIQEYQREWKLLEILQKRTKNIHDLIDEKLKSLGELKSKDPNENVRNKIDNIVDALDSLSPEIFIKISFSSFFEKELNSRVTLNCRIEYLYFLWFCLGYFQKEVFSNFQLVCIDEAQDISIQEIFVLKQLLGNNIAWNLYGDKLQNASSYKISEPDFTWDLMKKAFNAKLYVSNINYRNAKDIVSYCNNQFGLDIQAMGLDGKVIDDYSRAERCVEYLINLIKKETESDMVSSIAIIVKNLNPKIENKIKKHFVNFPVAFNQMAENKICVFDIKSVKGMEFRYGLVFSNGMTQNERYIAFTRVMEKLIVCRFPI